MNQIGWTRVPDKLPTSTKFIKIQMTMRRWDVAVFTYSHIIAIFQTKTHFPHKFSQELPSLQTTPVAGAVVKETPAK